MSVGVSSSFHAAVRDGEYAAPEVLHQRLVEVEPADVRQALRGRAPSNPAGDRRTTAASKVPPPRS